MCEHTSASCLNIAGLRYWDQSSWVPSAQEHFTSRIISVSFCYNVLFSQALFPRVSMKGFCRECCLPRVSWSLAPRSRPSLVPRFWTGVQEMLNEQKTCKEEMCPLCYFWRDLVSHPRFPDLKSLTCLQPFSNGQWAFAFFTAAS